MLKSIFWLSLLVSVLVIGTAVVYPAKLWTCLKWSACGGMLFGGLYSILDGIYTKGGGYSVGAQITLGMILVALAGLAIFASM